MPPLVRSHPSGVHPRARYLGEMAGSGASNKTCRKGLRRPMAKLAKRCRSAGREGRIVSSRATSGLTVG